MKGFFMFCLVERVNFGLVVLLLACTSIVHAATVTVMQDGTGDFELIQPGLDAVASGDTLLIGPGVYLDSVPSEISGYAWDVDVFAFVRVKELTIIGAGSNETIIGPMDYEGSTSTYSPKCLAWQDGTSLHLSGLTLRNCYEGIWAENSPIFVTDCRFLDNSIGISWFTGGIGGYVGNCQFEANILGGPMGGFIVGVGSGVLFEDCQFDGVEVSIKNVDEIVFRNCDIGNSVVGLQVDSGAHCLVENCRIYDCVNVGLGVSGSSFCEVRDSEISGGGLAATINSYSSLNAIDTVFNGGFWGVIEYSNANDSFVTNSHLFRGSGPLIRSFRHHTLGPVSHDMRNNFWDITDPDELRSLVLDGINDTDNASTVLFEPFVGGPVPTDKTTLDGLKAMYR